MPDQERADRFIAEMQSPTQERRTLPAASSVIRLPDDRPAEPPPRTRISLRGILDGGQRSGYGPDSRILLALALVAEMAVFITESDTEGGLDHIDSHRTMLLAAGP